jgi:hypothetical protein
MGKSRSVFFGDSLSDPKANKGKIPQTLMGGDLFEGFDLWGIQAQRDEFLFGSAKFHFNWLKRIQKISDTMSVPEPAFFFKGFKLWNYSSFHSELSPFVEPPLSLRHCPGSNYFCFMLPEIFKDNRQISATSRLPQGNVSIESRLKYKWFTFKQDFFYLSRVDSVSGNMQNSIVFPCDRLDFQCCTSLKSIMRNTIDVKKKITTAASPRSSKRSASPLKVGCVVGGKGDQRKVPHIQVMDRRRKYVIAKKEEI